MSRPRRLKGRPEFDIRTSLRGAILCRTTVPRPQGRGLAGRRRRRDKFRRTEQSAATGPARFRGRISGDRCGSAGRFAQDDGNRVRERVTAVGCPGLLEGHQCSAAARLTDWVQWDRPEIDERSSDARASARIEGHRETGTAWLTRFAEDATIEDAGRVGAAWQLARTEEHEEAGAALPTPFVEDTDFDGSGRVRAASGPAQPDGRREAGFTWLTHFSRDDPLDTEAVQRLRERSENTAQRS